MRCLGKGIAALFIECTITRCRVVSCRVVSCHVMPCHVMSCRVPGCTSEVGMRGARGGLTSCTLDSLVSAPFHSMQDASDCLACKLVVKIVRHKLSDPKTQVRIEAITQWFTRLLACSLTHALINSPTHALIHSLPTSLTHWRTHVLTHSVARSLTNSLTHVLTGIHSLTL